MSISNLHLFDVRSLVELGKKLHLYVYDTLVAYCGSMANVPYILPLNMLSQGMYQIVPKCPDTDRKVFRPISDDCEPFRDISHSVFVEPLADTM